MPARKLPKKITVSRSKKSRKANASVDPIIGTVDSGIETTATLKNKAPKVRIKKAAKSQKPAKVVHPKAPITFRHNILPPILGILMGVGVLGLLNAQWLIAQYQYRFMKPPAETSYTAAPAAVDPKAQPRLFIPKINVSAPVITDVKTYDQGPVQLALRHGVVQYGAASVDPGQRGNMVVIGHSSGQLWAPGDYKFVFTLLDKLVNDDRIIMDFKGKRYIYRVTSSKVVPPTDLSVLSPSDQPRLTLITCTPVGTSRNRLIITARQVSPKPETATVVEGGKAPAAPNIVIPN